MATQRKADRQDGHVRELIAYGVIGCTGATLDLRTEQNMNVTERLCVVMPVYNEEAAIGGVLRKWTHVLDELGVDYLIRPYNDGSKDGSLSALKEASLRHPRIDVRDKPNGGHGNTILTGYRDAVADGFDWVFQIDSDDEMGPEGFGALWAKRDDYDFLVGIRDGRKQPLVRKIISFVSRLCVRVFYGKGIWDVNTPYRLMRVAAFAPFYQKIPVSTFAPNVILSGLAARHRLRMFELPVAQHNRTTGEVSIRKWRLAKAAMKSFVQTMAFAFSENLRGQETLGVLAVRLSVIAVFSAGALFALLCLATPARLTIAILFLCAYAMLNKSQHLSRLIQVGGDWCRTHPWRALSTLAALSLLMIAVNRLCRGGDIISWQTGDAAIFWRYAKMMAAGSFPDVKSWTTVGAYALCIKVFGISSAPCAAVSLNVIIHLITGFLLFAYGRRAFGIVNGLAATAVYWLLPAYGGFALQMRSENFLFLFMAASLWTMARWMNRRSLGLIVATAGLCWLAVWSRGEGILLVIAYLMCLCATMIIERGKRRETLNAIVVFIVAIAVGGLIGISINMKWHGTKTCFCSYDSYWPKLFGSNVNSDGRCAGQAKRGKTNRDKTLILGRYFADHPMDTDLRAVMELPNQCHPKLIPYINKEIASRWNSMTFFDKCRFVIIKEHFPWCHLPGRRMGSIYVLVQDALAVVMLLFAAFWMKRERRALLLARTVTSCDLLRLLPLLFLFGMVCVLVVYESNIRYGLSCFLFAFYSFRTTVISCRSASR